jgi:hypothetical protein
VQDAAQLLDWRAMIIHAKVNQAVTVTAKSVARCHDHESRRLLAAPIASGGLAGG